MFESPWARPRRGKTLLISVALHGIAGGALVFAPLWAVQEPPDPDVRPLAVQPFQEVRLVEEPQRPRPAEPGRPKGNPLAGSPRSSAAARPAVLAPSEIPSSLPVPPEVAPSDEPLGSGSAGPTQPGPGLGLLPGPGGDPNGEDIYQASSPEVTPPLELFAPRPPYPQAALAARIFGLVILEAIVESDGTVRDARVLRSRHPLLDEAARLTILRWRYQPARVAGRAVPVYLTVTVDFKIQ